MSTRAEQVEALTRFGDNDVLVCLLGEVGAQKIRDAAATLTRDGELRERLANLCATARELGHPEAAALARHVEALLKETSDEQA